MKPLVSILIITITLLSVVFLQMEERRRGYAMLKLARVQRQIIEEKRIKSIQLAKIKRPQHVEQFAQSRLTLKKVQAHQIIHISAANSPELKLDNTVIIAKDTVVKEKGQEKF